MDANYSVIPWRADLTSRGREGRAKLELNQGAETLGWNGMLD